MKRERYWKKTAMRFLIQDFNYYYQPVRVFLENLVPDRQKWFLEGFYTEYYLLKSGIVSLPERAEYVKNPADLVFDSRLEIIPQYEHIFGDEENIQRLPGKCQDKQDEGTAF